MSATLAIDFHEIRQIFKAKASNSSRLLELARQAKYLATVVEESWEELPSEKQELLRIFAYAIIEPPKDLKSRLIAILDRLSAAWNISLIILKGEVYAFGVYSQAYQHLIDALLNSIENESEAYQFKLRKAIEESISEEVDKGQAMTVEEASDRIRSISNSIFE
ncbi:hypothetical protein JJD41_10360 [Oxynema sp. CENA135]|uniref:hypothetical protein n=1 Tax=Oxynema sp. CENA135 TaxID=984206 RepID=UPI00190CA238|nr:hypothetical protein [Oxynema sp. CENA135]MBK4730261.1 hypothetical protein [Oxynema sp. CENA135]